MRLKVVLAGGLGAIHTDYFIFHGGILSRRVPQGMSTLMHLANQPEGFYRLQHTFDVV